MAAERKATATGAQGISIVVSVAAVVVILVWLFGFGGAASLSPENVQLAIKPQAPSVDINETYRFITYRNDEWGFSLKHPIGLNAEEPEFEPSVFRAYTGQFGRLPEMIEVITDNTTTASSEFDQLFASSSDAGQTTRKTLSINGQHGYLAITRTAGPLAPLVSSDTAVIYQALFDCKNPYGDPYAAMVLVTIPQYLEVDLPVAEFVVGSFRC